MDVNATFVSSAKSAKLLEPGQRAFNNPAGFAQAAAVLVLMFADDGLDASPQEFLAMPPGPVGGVALQAVGALTGSPRLAFDLRNGVG